jgi:hypothetical protein
VPASLWITTMQLDWTDRHYRFLMRLITKRTLLYTEMLVDQTVRLTAHHLAAYGLTTLRARHS